MKKSIFSILLTIIVLFSLCTAVSAKTGDVIGYVKYTDISAYINHYPITSYNINGNTAIVAEDLANYGFKVTWNGANRTLTVVRSGSKNITPAGKVYKHALKAGQNSSPYYETDIITYVNGAKVESFSIGGKTCIYIDSLAPYGNLAWVPEVRAIKLWIDGLPTVEYKALQEEPSDDMLDVYAAILLRQYRAKMKDPSSFMLNSVYAGYHSGLYSDYDFVAIADVSGKNSYGGVTRSTYTMLLKIDSGKYILDLKGYADDMAEDSWGQDKIDWIDTAINVLKFESSAPSRLKKLDTNMITRLVLSD